MVKKMQLNAQRLNPHVQHAFDSDTPKIESFED